METIEQVIDRLSAEAVLLLDKIESDLKELGIKMEKISRLRRLLNEILDDGA